MGKKSNRSNKSKSRNRENSVSSDKSKPSLKDNTLKSNRSNKGLKNKLQDMKVEDDELDLKKIFMQHRKQELEEFASEKITEKKGGLLQMLNEPFCPPSMQFHNPKESSKITQK